MAFLLNDVLRRRLASARSVFVGKNNGVDTLAKEDGRHIVVYRRSGRRERDAVRAVLNVDDIIREDMVGSFSDRCLVLWCIVLSI